MMQRLKHINSMTLQPIVKSVIAAEEKQKKIDLERMVQTRSKT